MNVEHALDVLKGVGAISSAGNFAFKIREWLIGKASSGNLGPELKAVLDKLPVGSDAEAIVSVLMPFFAPRGGNVEVQAGSDGGGNVQVAHTQYTAGNGAGGGGDVRIVAGAGGPNGKGGDVTIVGGTFKAGDAK